jgi:hypothetical protein
MPSSTVKDHNDPVPVVPRRYFVKKHLHTVAVDMWKYQGIKNSISNGNRSIGIGILLSHHCPTKRANRLGAPTSSSIGNTTKSSLVLKHYPYRC